MTVKKKVTKSKSDQRQIDNVIYRGGNVSADLRAQSNKQSDQEVRFTLRIPQKLIQEIDRDRANRIGNVSRNQWILEAVAERLN